jgi:hypothetical protein
MAFLWLFKQKGERLFAFSSLLVGADGIEPPTYAV